MKDYVYNHEYRHPEYTNGEWEKNYFGGNPVKKDFETLPQLLQAIVNGYKDVEHELTDGTDHRIVKEPKNKEKEIIQ